MWILHPSKITKWLKYVKQWVYDNINRCQWTVITQQCAFFSNLEALNVVMAMFGWIMMNWVLNNTFYVYGIEFFEYTFIEDYPINPMDFYFPKMFKCTLKVMGSSGSDQKYTIWYWNLVSNLFCFLFSFDTICVLPI